MNPSSPPSAGARVSVIVLSWNRREDLRRCLDAVAAQTYADREIVVVDNGSTDGSADMVRSEYQAVRLIRSATNLGFAAGNNLAIRATDTPYVATLNNDALAEPGWLAALVAAAESDPTLGSVASKMVFQHDPSTINSCGIALDRAGIAWDLGGGLPAALVEKPREVFGPCAGAALYRRALLDDVGLFDEDFFAYLEDVDLAWRAHLRGWRCVLAPDAVVRHAHSGTLGEGSPLKRYLLARNKVWTVAKCLPTARLAADLPLAVLYDVGAVAFAVARHGDWAALRGRLAGLAGLPRVLRERAQVQRSRVIDGDALAALYSPLAPPWDVPRRYQHLLGVGGQGPLVGVGGRGLRARGQGSGIGGQGPGNRVGPLRPKTLLRRWMLQVLGFMLHQPQRPPPLAAGPRPLLTAPDPRPPIKVVVLRPDHLGDVLLSRPAIEALLAGGAQRTLDLTVVAGPWATASLQGLRARVVEFPFPAFTRAPTGGWRAPYAALLAFGAHLARERYDAALVLRPDHWWGALAAALAGIPIRVGHATPETRPFLTHSIEAVATEHAAHGALRAAAKLAKVLELESFSAADPIPRFEPSAGAQMRAEAWVAKHVGDRRPIVMVHPGAGAAVKTWPARRWAHIAQEMNRDAAVVLTGAAPDADSLAGIQAACPRPLPCASDVDWDRLAALYRCADLVVGLDSGPLHLAAAVGTPTVRIYGPTDPRVYGPAPGRSEEVHQVLQGTLPCVPCGNLVDPPCGYLQDPPCLASVGPEQVVKAVRTALRELTPA